MIVLLETRDWIALDKPAGLETIDPDGRASLTTRAREFLGFPTLEPVHRLDRGTTGATLFAKTPSARERLEGWFRGRRVVKTYLGLCLGVPRGRDGTIRRALSDWRGGRRPVWVVKGGGGLRAETRAVRLWPEAYPSGPVDARDGVLSASLMVFEPREGRTHQIRVHAEAFGHPLLGDDQYGDRAANRIVRDRFGLRRQALHAWRLDTPEGGVESPPPEDFLRVCEGLFPGVLQRIYFPAPSRARKASAAFKKRPASASAVACPRASAYTRTMGSVFDERT